jgi:hypothetical protein
MPSSKNQSSSTLVLLACEVELEHCEKQHYFWMTFEVLTVMSMNMAVLWDVAPCSLVDSDQSFRGAYRLHHLGDK